MRYIHSWKSKVRKSDPVLLRPCWLPTGWKITPVFIGKSSISLVKKQKTALAFRFPTPCVCGKRGGTPESSRKKKRVQIGEHIESCDLLFKKMGWVRQHGDTKVDMIKLKWLKIRWVNRHQSWFSQENCLDIPKKCSWIWFKKKYLHMYTMYIYIYVCVWLNMLII